ncbi:MAG TPA: hypothetical protein VGO37_20685 [Steroidobacteraceae bacterium]|jgi:hypothetical protein|nr:hypothetical protein [Steroidobacteraceae bacterium]
MATQKAANGFGFGFGVACAALVLLGAGASTSWGDEDGRDQARIRIGLETSPVALNLRGKDRRLVGLGGYLVNVVADCNGCHSVPQLSYAQGGNPYFKGNQPKVVNQAVYLSGGQDFGQLIPGITPNIVSRNLTPDKTGMPAGGRSWPEFRLIIRTGADLDHLHPNCSAAVGSNCFPAFQPFNGDLLQIMPWPAFQSMTDHDLRAIYEYLSAIPCVAGPPTGVLHNDCF